MLEPRESDIPALFLVFVVLPLVSYFLLGKWNETTKGKEMPFLIASGAAEEALRVNDMAVCSVMPVMHLPNSGIRQCARCFEPAKTRCSQCKAVWYCSGRCQIVHWRQVHKLECQQLGKDFHSSSLKRISSEGSRGNMWQQSVNNASPEIAVSPTQTKLNSAASSGALFNSSEGVTGSGFTLSSSQPPEDAYLRGGDFSISVNHANSPHVSSNGDGDLRSALHESEMVERECLNAVNCSFERPSTKRSKSRITSQSNGNELHKHSKPRGKTSKEPQSSDTDIKSQPVKDSRIPISKDNTPLQENNRVANMGTTKSAKADHYRLLEDSTIKKRKMKMIFPYDEFVKCFQYEVFNMIPRGLINCGNSCYANAVLQCLTCTKPMIMYLLRQSHSKSGCAKDWCLMCELEQLVMLRQSRGPLSPVNILMYIRSLNTQIGDGSQEDAHEFLRLLVASMQSICLEGYGGEKAVDPRLQDTTFIQHTFGGCLRSKVKCLRCHHESERDDKMMDLTLEIYGWVESLEDALTQFTSSEDLDGDNMYRCSRCAAYVRARKQLNIKEAPNILTIVLKRFQEGNYGKINKCITFPEMLDMIPFMTGTDDMPPLYMLYAVVVHLDTSNASFSGHYISYVKDLQGNWFRVDDTEVLPVELSHVMSEGAYILFYMRSYPRPARCSNGKATRDQTKAQRSPRREPHSGHKLDENADSANISRGILIRESRSRPSTLRNYAELSDAASSDWSLFTNSDDSSFTTESTRDSVSTVDHTDAPFASVFQSLYPAESTSRRTISCRVFPASKPQTRFAREETGSISVSNIGGQGMRLNYGGEARKGQPQTYVNCTT